MKCQAQKRHGSLGNALVDKLIVTACGAAWLLALWLLIAEPATARAGKLSALIGLAVAGFGIVAYAAARARARVRHEAQAKRIAESHETERELREQNAQLQRHMTEAMARHDRRAATLEERNRKMSEALAHVMRPKDKFAVPALDFSKDSPAMRKSNADALREAIKPGRFESAIGIDHGTPGGDMAVTAYGERNPDGSIRFTRFEKSEGQLHMSGADGEAEAG